MKSIEISIIYIWIKGKWPCVFCSWLIMFTQLPSKVCHFGRFTLISKYWLVLYICTYRRQPGVLKLIWLPNTNIHAYTRESTFPIPLHFTLLITVSFRRDIWFFFHVGDEVLIELIYTFCTIRVECTLLPFSTRMLQEAHFFWPCFLKF